MLAAEVLRRLHRVHPDGAAALHEPVFAGNEWTYLKESIDSGWVSSAGERVAEFERGLARFTDLQHSVATVNGTAALHLALLLVGVRAEDEVLVPALSFVAAANAVSYCGAVPHLVESCEKTLGVDPEKLERYLAECAQRGTGTLVNRHSGRPIRALVVVHSFGHPAAIDTLADLCASFGIALVEDAAEALGSRFQGRHAGSFGRVAVLSFNGNKIITTGGGGAVLTADQKLAERARHLSTTAKRDHPWEMSHDEVGFNYRMPALNAALGCAQLELLPRLLSAKRALATAYQQAFDGLDGVSIYREPAGARSNYWLNLLVLDADQRDQRDSILEATHEGGMATRAVWTPLHRLPMYAACPRMDLDLTDDLATRLIALPSTPRIAAADAAE